MRTTILALIGMLATSVGTASSASFNETVKASPLQQANLSYAAILAGGVKAGRLYSREATASGARRHAREFLARQFVPLPQTSSAE